jgi:hypothetical protein
MMQAYQKRCGRCEREKWSTGYYPGDDVCRTCRGAEVWAKRKQDDRAWLHRARLVRAHDENVAARSKLEHQRDRINREIAARRARIREIERQLAEHTTTEAVA